jgi:hypothetical protein
MVAAVLTLLVAEGCTLWYLAGERVARAPDDLLSMADLQERFDAAKRRAAPGLSQLRRSAAPVNSTVTSAPAIPQVRAARAAEGDSLSAPMQDSAPAPMFSRIPTVRPLGAFQFQLSPSVVEDCQRAPESGCRRLEEFLYAMAQERRDPVWATDMEARLAQLVTRGERDNYWIRSLECRNTRCAVEVASVVDYAGVSLVSDDVLDRSLRWYGGSATAWEVDPTTGAKIIVTVATWQKRFNPVGLP